MLGFFFKSRRGSTFVNTLDVLTIQSRYSKYFTTTCRNFVLCVNLLFSFPMQHVGAVFSTKWRFMNPAIFCQNNSLPQVESCHGTNGQPSTLKSTPTDNLELLASTRWQLACLWRVRRKLHRDTLHWQKESMPIMECSSFELDILASFYMAGLFFSHFFKMTFFIEWHAWPCSPQLFCRLAYILLNIPFTGNAFSFYYAP